MSGAQHLIVANITIPLKIGILKHLMRLIFGKKVNMEKHILYRSQVTGTLQKWFQGALFPNRGHVMLGTLILKIGYELSK